MTRQGIKSRRKKLFPLTVSLTKKQEKEKPIGTGKGINPISPALNEAGAFVHKKIHEAEHDNAGVEAAHKTEKAAEHLEDSA